MWSVAPIYLYTANHICNDILNINITFLLFHRADILYRITSFRFRFLSHPNQSLHCKYSAQAIFVAEILISY